MIKFNKSKVIDILNDETLRLSKVANKGGLSQASLYMLRHNLKNGADYRPTINLLVGLANGLSLPITHFFDEV